MDRYDVFMQDESPSAPRYHAFLLRMSQPEPGAPWQIFLKAIDQDQQYLFKDTHLLLEFLEMLIAEERSEKISREGAS